MAATAMLAGKAESYFLRHAGFRIRPRLRLPAFTSSAWYAVDRYGMVQPVEFEWDLSKDNENIRKHGVSFAEAVESFLDPQGFQLTDCKHSWSEKRSYWIGRLATGRVLTTRFTKRGNTIRIIGSAEWRKFRRLYHETTKASPSQARPRRH